jgi:hypothetical protein
VANARVWATRPVGPVNAVPLVVPDDERVRRAAAANGAAAPLRLAIRRDTRSTVYRIGLAEYEADANGDVAVTLVRAVGDLSRTDLPERPGHAGCRSDPRGADARRVRRGARAVSSTAHATPETLDTIERTADDVCFRSRVDTVEAQCGLRAERGLELEGRGPLAVSAAKESEDGEWLVIPMRER